MDEITIRLLSRDDAKELFEFETENREYFESVWLPRNVAYYEWASFLEMLHDSLEKQENDQSYIYSIFDRQGKMVGRISLMYVERGYLNMAEIGYRLAKHCHGRGYATAAAGLALERAKDVHKLHKLEAVAALENIASQRVLEKNGFRFVGKYEKHIFLNGKWEDSLLFEKILD